MVVNIIIMEHKVTKEKIDELRKIFMSYDKNNVGSISPECADKILRNKIFEIKNPEKIISDIISNEKNSVTLEDLVRGLQNYNKELDTKTNLIKAFKVFDKQGTGAVSTLELINIMTKLQKEIGSTEDEIQQLVTEADFDHDGLINYIEFVEMLFEI